MLTNINGARARARYVSLTALLSALYIVLSFAPFSSFIGGPGFITANIIVIPVIALLLSPKYALVSGFIGGLGVLMFGIGLASMYGPYSIAITVVPCLLGSLAAYARYAIGTILQIGLFIAVCIFYMVSYSFQATPLLLLIYISAIIMALLSTFFKRFKLKMTSQVFPTTITELAMMNIGSIIILGLPAGAWLAIVPLAALERILSTSGSLLLLWGIRTYIDVKSQ